MNALEFYSGIGGLHLALSHSGVPAPARVVRAFDWDAGACAVYAANFGPGLAAKADISTLTAASLAPLRAALWLLSPACQPYTVLNPASRSKGDRDPRAKSFLHLVQTVLPALAAAGAAPTHVLVENVAGFETSRTRTLLVSTLRTLGYATAEFLLTPLQFGIPNSRLRYYLLAKRAPRAFKSRSESPGPVNLDGEETLRYIPGRSDRTWVDRRADSLADDTVYEIRDYLDPEPVEGCAIPDRVLGRWGRLFDIVLPSARRSCCFTRGYTQLVERSGSVLQTNEAQDVTTRVFDAFLRAQSQSQSQAEAESSDSATENLKAEAVRTLDVLGLRYFSPAELLRLFAFTAPHGNARRNKNTPPQNALDERPFVWPGGVSRKTQYRLIGNSVNVRVVQELIGYLFEEP
ncbi:S-adenosyl-L-methionine-dependent methyltransferase [Mycena belliarum]|uniref:tRNA (cytosine(38)-C(5))-methyltransferase n=1 Tax=Mycena belliarum TaxID=1033014 RepID=A0AAD6UNF8_9AGAR|nr:S-adenosyl-L-methionine-dependent methyltransferase [Mycena belliae]